MYQLSIAAIVRDENDYLPEWIEFHLLQGVEHFYITEHEPRNGKLRELLAPYLFEGLVTLAQRTGRRPQLVNYQSVLEWYEGTSEWIAFIDADEFLFAPGNSLRDGLKDMPPDIGAYAVNWTLFGSNGHKFKTEGLVVERFTKRSDKFNPHVKSIVRPSLIKSVGKNPHCFYLKDDARGTRGYLSYQHILPKEYALMHEPISSPFRLNHYHTKSEIEYRKKKLYPRADNGELYSIERVDEMFKAHDCNDVEDLLAADFASQIKENLKKRYGSSY